MKWLKLLLTVTLIFSVLGACGKKEEKAEGDKEKKPKAAAQSKEANNKLMRAHYLEEEVESMNEVGHATVVLQNKDAYVAVELNQKGTPSLNEKLKNQMVGIIRTTDPEVNNIYISNNTDFNARMQGISRDIERGIPEKDIGESFSQTVKKIFPELKR
jgi:spore cortex protein